MNGLIGEGILIGDEGLGKYNGLGDKKNVIIGNGLSDGHLPSINTHSLPSPGWVWLIG